MSDHCKGCRYLWLGRPDKRKWCCKMGMFAKRSVSHCKLMDYKDTSNECLPDIAPDAKSESVGVSDTVASHPVTSSPVVDHKTGNMSDNDLIERVARDIADALGDNFDYAFAGKSDWITHRGETPAGFRDVNQPYRPDYIDAAIAAIAAIDLPGQREAAARAALEAAASIEESRSWSAGLKAHEIRAIDPAAFRGGNDATG